MVAAGMSRESDVEGMREGVRAYLRFWSESPRGRPRLVTRHPGGRPGGPGPPRAHARELHTPVSGHRRASSCEQAGLPTVPATVRARDRRGLARLATEYVRQDRVSSLPRTRERRPLPVADGPRRPRRRRCRGRSLSDDAHDATRATRLGETLDRRRARAAVKWTWWESNPLRWG